MRPARLLIILIAPILALPLPHVSGDVIIPLTQGSHASGWEVVIPDNFLFDVVTDFVQPGDNGFVIIETSKEFDGAGGASEPVAFTFNQVADDENTVPWIAIANEFITNSTGALWTDFHWSIDEIEVAAFNAPLSSEFGVGLQFDEKQFVPIVSTTNIGGDLPDDKASAVNAFGGDGVPSGTSWNPGAGRGELVIGTSVADSAEPVSFTLNQVPITPEPAALTVLALATTMIVRRPRDC